MKWSLISVFGYPGKHGKEKGEKNSVKIKFLELLSHTNWEFILNLTDTQRAFSEFHTLYKRHFETAFPVIKVRFQYNNRKPWLSEPLRDQIRDKNKLYIKSDRIQTLHNKLSYDNAKIILNRSLLAAEKQHIEMLFDKHKSNLTKTWNVIKGILNRNKSQNIQKKIISGDNIITEKKRHSRKVQQFFH